MNELSDKLGEYVDSDIYRFHMPGHKGNGSECYKRDITEIDGFDNLHHPQEVLLQAMNKTSEFYGSRRTWYLVNGSTCGILAAISAVAKSGDTLLIGRNSHRAVYNALYINKLKASYIYPQNVDKYDINGGICLSDVEKVINCQTNIRAIFITSPTYEGVVSDIEGISELAHRYGIPVIVDEAHGAHFGMDKQFPESALKKGADVVIQSLHKTMNSMTQTAIIHTSHNCLISDEELSRYLSIYQTSSPSYILMESIDKCINEIISDGNQLMSAYVRRLEKFYRLAKELNNLKVADDISNKDIGKIVISVKGTDKNGKWLYDSLRERYRIQPEMMTETYVVCMTSYMDKDEGFDRLIEALTYLDKEVNISKIGVDITPLKSSIVCEDICDSMDRYEQEKIKLRESEDRISGEYIYLYPPGIPLVVPGELLTRDVLEKIYGYISQGLNVQGLEDMQCEYIYVLKK